MTATLDIRPGIAAVIRNAEGALLLHLRRVGDGWAPPSGHIEPGESIEQALHREVAEETGLIVHLDGLVGVYSDPRFQIVAYPDGRRVHFVTSLLACTVAGGTLAGSDEARQWAWFEADALPDNLLAYARVWIADAIAWRATEPRAVPIR